MTITPFGYVFFFILLLLITLSVFVNKRMNEESDTPNGCFGFGFLSLLVVSVTSLFIMCAAIFILQFYSVVAYPKYESTIVDVHSEWVEKEYTNDDGYSYTETVEMHTAVLEFHDGDGKLLRLENNISSEDKPNIGDKLTVSYRNENLYEFSIRSNLMLLGVTVMMILLGSISTGIVLYAFNKSTERVQAFGWGFVFYFVVPAGMLLLLCFMLYALWEQYANGGDMPIWVQALIILFSVFLVPSLFGYVKNLLQPDRADH